MNFACYRDFRVDFTHIHRRKKVFLSLTTLVTTSFAFFSLGSRMRFSTRTASVASNHGRPIMHTFYEKLSVGEDDLLEVWKEEWNEAGFEVKVLKLEDAQRHPYCKDMERVVFGNVYHNPYDTLCFYRWLAMAASGGGWMCDYDTFPTNFPIEEGKNLPNNGKFTSFENHVPSLMSGTATEWTRVAKLLVEAIPKIPEDVKSDMHAFQILEQEGTHDVDFRHAKLNMSFGFPYKKSLSAGLPREVDCNKIAERRAIHFAHAYVKKSYQEGMFPLHNVTSLHEAMFKQRAEAARIFLADWRVQCKH